jgi:hypothetical protein
MGRLVFRICIQPEAKPGGTEFDVYTLAGFLEAAAREP